MVSILKLVAETCLVVSQIFRLIRPSEDLDEKDFKIMEMLVRDGRASYTDIGRSVGLSDVAVLKRVKKLERLGVIRGYTAVIDPRRLGFNAISITGIDVEPQSLFAVIEKLKNMPNAIFIAITSGDHQVIAVMIARDSDELARLINEISKIEGVKRVCPSIVLEAVKCELPAWYVI